MKYVFLPTRGRVYIYTLNCQTLTCYCQENHITQAPHLAAVSINASNEHADLTRFLTDAGDRVLWPPDMFPRIRTKP